MNKERFSTLDNSSSSIKGSGIICFIILLICTFGCYENETNVITNQLNYSTSSDSSLFYYRLGWQQIMDEGRYTAAESSYRQTLKFDPEFLIGQSVLARLTQDLNERIQLYNHLESQKSKITGDERLVLDVYIALIEFTNIREQTPDLAPSKLEEVLLLAENNFGQVIYRYPDEIYLLCEYIEILHARHGPQTALDSLKLLTSDSQKLNPFLLGYAAHMLAELGQFKAAFEKISALDSLVTDSNIPKSHIVKGDLYFQMDSLFLAKSFIDKAIILDPGNLDAFRLQAQIEKRLVE